ncbi:MAG: TAXI family TRAP transporter solute-binding subunit [Rhodospirillales bacterium]
MRSIFGFAAAAALLVCAPALAADDIKLPSTVTWTSYPVGTAPYNQAVGIGSVLKNKLGVTLRVVPGNNDIGRQVPVRDGRAPFALTGTGALFAQEGLEEFAARDWGPQRMRMVVMSYGRAHSAVVTAKDANIKTMGDLKGKRVAFVRGSPSLNATMEAMLAFANLTWNDVQKVEVPGFSGSIDGIINGQIDAATLISTSGFAQRLSASPRGIWWPPVPHADKAGWDRLLAVAPWMAQAKDPVGEGIPKDGTFEGVGLPYPYLAAYDTVDAGLAYNMAKAIYELFPEYKTSAPGADGYALDRQLLSYTIPWHESSIRYFKEKGIWKPENQAHHDKLLKRQDVLVAAWKAFLPGQAGKDDEALRAAWPAAREAALKQAGLPLK